MLGVLAQMVSEGADKPRQVMVGPGHVVMIHPEVDGSTGHLILSTYLILSFAQCYNMDVQVASTLSRKAFVVTDEARRSHSTPRPLSRPLKSLTLKTAILSQRVQLMK